MLSKTFCPIAVFIISAISFIHALPGRSIPFGNIADKVSEESAGKELTIKELWNGYRLDCRTQDLQAEVTTDGTIIRSTSDAEGEGVFTIRAARIGRVNAMNTISPAVDWVTTDNNVVKSGHGNIVEEYSASGDGIRQDFVINSRPGGKGMLILELEVEGAIPGGTSEAITMRLSCGRELVYHALKVIDAAGRTLNAGFEKTQKNTVTAAVDDNDAKYPLRIDPTITDVDWMSMGGMPGVDGYISDIAIDKSGGLYAGGYFSIAGQVAANNVAKWNGSEWSALGSGTNYEVKVLSVDDSGNLYAGGFFDTAGGIKVNYIAKWNGSEWSALGSGTGGFVEAIVISDSGILYAGGSFQTAGECSANNVAKWDGTAWSPVGNDLPERETPHNTCYSLAIDKSGDLYAGGNFDSLGLTSALNIAKWNGSSWSALGSGIGDIYSHVSSIAFDSSGKLYVCGSFDSAGGIPANCIAKWDGAVWRALEKEIGGKYSDAYTIAFDKSGSLLVGGYIDSTPDGALKNNIARWDGNSWSKLGKGICLSLGVYSIITDEAGNLYAGGTFEIAGGIAADHIAKWSNGEWSALGSGTNSSIRTLVADSSGDLYAAGNFVSICGTAANHIAKWDGSKWKSLGSGVKGGLELCVINSVVLDNSGNVYVMGVFDTAGDVAANNIAKWNGSTWSALGSGIINAPEYCSVFEGLAVDNSGNLYAGGDFDTAGGIKVNHIAKWNGSEWSALGSGIIGCVNALAADDSGNLYAGGMFDTAGGIKTKNIAKWNGSSWSGLGSGLNGWPYTVNALVFDKTGNLYAGGGFDTADGVHLGNVARWDGSKWNTLGSGIDHIFDFDLRDIGVLALSFDSSGNLYAGGDFDTAGGKAANFIARWDGSEWSPLGSGFGQNVYCVQSIAVDKYSNLYAGGNFLVAGGKVSPYFAMCSIKSLDIKSDTHRAGHKSLTFIPNSDLIRCNLQSSTVVNYRIVNLTGREVYHSSKLLPEGTRSFRIDTPDLSQGTYILQVKAGNESMRCILKKKK